MVQGSQRLGEILVERGLLAPEALAAALEAQGGTGRLLGEVLVEQGLVDEAAIRWALAEQMDLPLVHPDPETLDPEALALLPADLCRRYGVLPLYRGEGSGQEGPELVLAAADPSHREALDDVSRRVGMRVRVVAALREELEEVIDRVYGPGEGTDVSVRAAGVCTGCEDVILGDPTGNALLRQLLGAVVARGEGGFHLRVRDDELRAEDLDGKVLFRGGRTWHTILMDRLRQLAALDPRRGGAVQRGRFVFGGDPGAPRLFRLSILRGVSGEEAQVRLLRQEGPPRAVEELGFRPEQVAGVRAALERPGMTWVTGPTEGGLASTLFGLMHEIPRPGRTITIEEEVFYRSPELLQVETLNLTPAGRREVIRELKYLDFERVVVDRVSPGALGDLLALAARSRWVLGASAASSLEESLTTLAARSRDLPLFALRLVVHQRLVPLLCPGCRVECALGPGERDALARWLPGDAGVFQEGAGCDRCGGRGLAGTRAFFQVLPVDQAARDTIYRAGWGDARLDELVRRAGPSMAEQVAGGVAGGEISLAELWDVI